MLCMYVCMYVCNMYGTRVQFVGLQLGMRMWIWGGGQMSHVCEK